MPKKLAFIAWSQPTTRSDSLARHLGTECRYIFPLPAGRKFFGSTSIRYSLSALKTWSVLREQRPDVALVSNPPVFAVLAVWLYSLASGGQFISDNHSAAFNLKRWQAFLWLFRFLACQAVMNLCHNEPLAGTVSGWGAPALALGDIPYHLESGREFLVRPGFNLVFPCTFAEDEPVEVVIEAARQLPQAAFYITGDYQGTSPDLPQRVPPNVILTGFLPRPDYVALLRACHSVIALTTRDLTVQNAVYEAIELGKPAITSAWPVLQSTYPLGTLHVDNTPASLAKAVLELQANYPRYQEEMKRLRESFHAAWNERLSALLDLMG
jgi:glycosyltransferase involved in cell wall biosynthesis